MSLLCLVLGSPGVWTFLGKEKEMMDHTDWPTFFVDRFAKCLVFNHLHLNIKCFQLREKYSS